MNNQNIHPTTKSNEATATIVPIDLGQQYAFAIDTIAGVRHKDYNQVVSLQKENTALAIGDGYEDLIVYHKNRESKEKFKDRQKKTYARTPEIIERNATFLERLYQQPKRIMKLTIGENEDHALLRSVSQFGDNGETLLKWVETNCLVKAKERPNDFVFIRYDEDTRDFTPEIIYCEDVLNFKKRKGIYTDFVCQYLLDVAGALITQYMYLTSGEFVYFTAKQEGGSDKQKQALSVFYDQVRNEGTYQGEESINNISYIVTSAPFLEQIPVFSFGYIQTTKKGYSYYVPFWEKIRLMLKRFVGDGTKLDVTEDRHGFPKAIELVDKCTHKDDQGRPCVDGTIMGTGEECPICHGKGYTSITSEHDVMMIPLPDDFHKDYSLPINPKDIATTVEAPITTMDYFRKIVDSHTNRSCEVIFGVDLSKYGNGPVTATQVLNHQGTSNGVIAAYSELPERIYAQIVGAMADYLGLPSDGYDSQMEYSKDMTFASERDLVELLGNAKQAGASPTILESIEKRLRETQQRNHSLSVRNMEAIEAHKPYRHVSDQAAATFVLNLPATHPNRVLWENFPAISNIVSERNALFASKSIERQAELIQQVVDEYVQKEKDIIETSLSADLQQFMNPEDETEEDEA